MRRLAVVLFIGFWSALPACDVESNETDANDQTLAGSPDQQTGEQVAPDSVPAVHPQCTQPPPQPLPALPNLNLDPTGHPCFDDWRRIDCGVVSHLLCSGPADEACSPKMCLPLAADGRGVCTYADIDIWCDGEGEVMGYRDGQCYTCTPDDTHAAACCAGLDGVDCRAWPYPADGKPGMVCARHADCEPGLICGPHRGSGYGICQCPEVYGSDLAPGDSCWP